MFCLWFSTLFCLGLGGSMCGMYLIFPNWLRRWQLEEVNPSPCIGWHGKLVPFTQLGKLKNKCLKMRSNSIHFQGGTGVWNLRIKCRDPSKNVNLCSRGQLPWEKVVYSPVSTNSALADVGGTAISPERCCWF